jgi:hypothetical protein
LGAFNNNYRYFPKVKDQQDEATMPCVVFCSKFADSNDFDVLLSCFSKKEITLVITCNTIR